MNEDPIKLLGNAIIVQAAKDYRAAQKIYHETRSPEIKGLYKGKLKRLEMFFRGEWALQLTEADCEVILEKLQEEQIGERVKRKGTIEHGTDKGKKQRR